MEAKFITDADQPQAGVWGGGCAERSGVPYVRKDIPHSEIELGGRYRVATVSLSFTARIVKQTIGPPLPEYTREVLFDNGVTVWINNRYEDDNTEFYLPDAD